MQVQLINSLRVFVITFLFASLFYSGKAYAQEIPYTPEEKEQMLNRFEAGECVVISLRRWFFKEYQKLDETAAAVKAWEELLGQIMSDPDISAEEKEKARLKIEREIFELNESTINYSYAIAFFRASFANCEFEP